MASPGGSVGAACAAVLDCALGTTDEIRASAGQVSAAG